MNVKNSCIAVSLLVSAQLSMSSWAQAANFSTLIKTPLAIEGLTNDNAGNLYTTGRAAPICPVWRVNIASPSLVVVGNIPGPCSPSGLAFDKGGKLYVVDNDKIWSFMPNSSAPPTATVFATGVPGTNGLAFDGDGNVWTGDGTTGQGRIWKITPAGVVTEMFRVQPMANELNPANNGGVANVGRDARTLPPGTIAVTPTSRNAVNNLGSQPLVANGVQFTKDGDLLIVDTARGAVWKVESNRHGDDRDGDDRDHGRNGGGNYGGGGTQLRAKTGCDTTFTANTLCLQDHIFVQHPLLEGADGFVLDQADNLWVAANERNAMVFVSRKGEVIEVFRNPVAPATQLRNEGPLETPTSPALYSFTLCTANSDGNRRDNFPNTAGEIKPTGPDRGKISCMIERTQIQGAPLPVR
jgi:sugar lactone lactonase YvrE